MFVRTQRQATNLLSAFVLPFNSFSLGEKVRLRGNAAIPLYFFAQVVTFTEMIPTVHPPSHAPTNGHASLRRKGSQANPLEKAANLCG